MTFQNFNAMLNYYIKKYKFEKQLGLMYQLTNLFHLEL